MVRIPMSNDNKLDEILEKFQDHLAELKEEASGLRKIGKDTSMADIIILDVVPQIKLTKATQSWKDADNVKALLAKIRHELDIAKEGEDFDAMLEKIQKTAECIRTGQLSEAIDKYVDMRNLYPKLPADLKKIVYSVSLQIHDDLKRLAEENSYSLERDTRYMESMSD